jgi:hypothetical protein
MPHSLRLQPSARKTVIQPFRHQGTHLIESTEISVGIQLTVGVFYTCSDRFSHTHFETVTFRKFYRFFWAICRPQHKQLQIISLIKVCSKTYVIHNRIKRVLCIQPVNCKLITDSSKQIELETNNITRKTLIL